MSSLPDRPPVLTLPAVAKRWRTDMNSGPTLSQGSTGPKVRRLQRLFVMMKSAPVEAIDGIFGPKSKTAVIDFQTGNGLTADGIVGNQTWAKLPADPNLSRRSRNQTGPDFACANDPLSDRES